MLESENGGVQEPDPAEQVHGDDTVARRTLIVVQHFTGVEKLVVEK